MAVKRLPSGVNVDMGFSDESPMDKLNKLLSAVGTVAAGVGAVREQRNTEQLNTITMLNETIDRARSPQELERIKSMVDDIPFNNHNDSINLAAEAVRVKHAQSSEDFKTVQSLGDEITAEMSRMLTFTNKDGEEISKSFQNMNAEELVAYSKQTSKEGIVNEINSLRAKMTQYAGAGTSLFGAYDGRNFKKTPNMTFTMSDGTKIKTPEFLAKMGSYGDSMDTMINALGNDGVLSVEEAQAIIDGDSEYYNQLRKEKGDNLRIRIPQLNRSLDSINKEIAKLEKPNADVAEVIRLVSQDPDLANNATLINKLSLLSNSSINTIEDLATDEDLVNQPNKVLTTLRETRRELISEYQKQLVIADAWGFEDAYGKPIISKSDLGKGDSDGDGSDDGADDGGDDGGKGGGAADNSDDIISDKELLRAQAPAEPTKTYLYGNVDVASVDLSRYGTGENANKRIQRKIDMIPENANEKIVKAFIEDANPAVSWDSFIRKGKNKEDFFVKDKNNIIELDMNQIAKGRKLKQWQLTRELKKITSAKPGKIFKLKGEHYTAVPAFPTGIKVIKVTPGTKTWNELKSK